MTVVLACSGLVSFGWFLIGWGSAAVGATIAYHTRDRR